MNVKVSVLMPIYKTKEAYLRTAIESILNQTFGDFEFLILDDCPNDTREDIVKSYHDARIKYLKNDKNLGITPSRNKLIEMAKGEYLATMDHDDISLPTRFEKQVAYLDSHKNVGVVGCLEESFPNYIDHYYPEKDKDIKMALTCRCAISHPASMIRKSVLIDNNIRYEQRYSPAEDYRLWLRLMEYTDFHNIQEVLFRYRYHRHNTTHRQIDKMVYAGEELHYLAQKAHPELYAKFKKQRKYRWRFFGIESLPFKEKSPKIIHKTKNQENIILKKPILVHLHIFYPELYPELKSYIQNILPYSFDLYVTMVQKHPDVENDIKENFPNAHIEVVENRGYDVAPFIHILNRVDLSNYDFVIKLHTKGTKAKGTKNFRGFKQDQWRKSLLSFLKSHELLTNYLKTFQYSELGMTGSYQCLISKDYYAGRKCLQRFSNFIEENELGFINFSFIGGCIFLCRSNVLRPIQNLRLEITDFEPPEKGCNYSLAHVMERMFGYYTEFIGYKCADYVVPRWKQNIWLSTRLENIKIHFFLLKYFILYKVFKKKRSMKGK